MSQLSRCISPSFNCVESIRTGRVYYGANMSFVCIQLNRSTYADMWSKIRACAKLSNWFFPQPKHTQFHTKHTLHATPELQTLHRIRAYTLLDAITSGDARVFVREISRCSVNSARRWCTSSGGRSAAVSWRPSHSPFCGSRVPEPHCRMTWCCRQPPHPIQFRTRIDTMEKLAEEFLAESELQLEHRMEEFDLAKSQLLAQINESAAGGVSGLHRRKQVGCIWHKFFLIFFVGTHVVNMGFLWRVRWFTVRVYVYVCVCKVYVKRKKRVCSVLDYRRRAFTHFPPDRKTGYQQHTSLFIIEYWDGTGMIIRTEAMVNHETASSCVYACCSINWKWNAGTAPLSVNHQLLYPCWTRQVLLVLLTKIEII